MCGRWRRRFIEGLAAKSEDGRFRFCDDAVNDSFPKMPARDVALRYPEHDQVSPIHFGDSQNRFCRLSILD